uniref:SP140 nuclear body protein like n=1 Tax=Rousettus aegyptiacus TaxID=9407 RepID=A0A7J8JNL8_ROUAE|nr:SP140 nuclear body protein like [Rousettus aegyptiacus]
MACGSGNLIARISAANRNIDRRLIREIALEHFKKIKVEISDAIETTFPFLEILRDRGFISEKIYEDSQDSCRNLIPVQKVVYNVLSEVEKTFDLSLLETLFNEVMMKSYPALKRIFESFIAVIQQGNRQERNETERRESLTAQQSLEQGTGENYLPWINTDASHSNGLFLLIVLRSFTILILLLWWVRVLLLFNTGYSELSILLLQFLQGIITAFISLVVWKGFSYFL